MPLSRVGRKGKESVWGLEHCRKKIDKMSFYGLVATLDLHHGEGQINVTKHLSVRNKRQEL